MNRSIDRGLAGVGVVVLDTAAASSVFSRRYTLAPLALLWHAAALAVAALAGGLHPAAPSDLR